MPLRENAELRPEFDDPRSGLVRIAAEHEAGGARRLSLATSPRHGECGATTRMLPRTEGESERIRRADRAGRQNRQCHSLRPLRPDPTSLAAGDSQGQAISDGFRL